MEKAKLLTKDIEKMSKMEGVLNAISLENLQRGVSVDMKNLAYSFSESDITVRKLNIQAGETVGLTGYGSRALTSLLYRILPPSKGILAFNQINILSIEEQHLKEILGVIPSNPVISGVTIKLVLNQK